MGRVLETAGSIGKHMGSMMEALGSVFSSCLTSVLELFGTIWVLLGNFEILEGF